VTEKLVAVTGALLAGTAVGLGAFGAHGLKSALTEGQLQTFETGVRYQMYHALAMLAAAWLTRCGAGWPAWLAGGSFLAGIVLFSGSLYLLATKTQLGIEHWRWLGLMTPIGGLCFLSGWLLCALAAWRAPG
jgi:uncharacterized membrane protein YgdD (TMEM256/DUF423 family)